MGRLANVTQAAGAVLKAAVGLFSSPGTAQAAYGLLSGIMPGAIGAAPRRGTREFLRLYTTSPWLRAVVHKIAFSVSAVEWTLATKVGRTGRAEPARALQRMAYSVRHKTLATLRQAGQLRELDSHPFLDAWHGANEYMTGISMRQLVQIDLELAGEFFLVKERNRLGAPMALWPLPPNWVLSTPTPQRPTYRVGFRGWQGEIPDTEILWDKILDPENPYGRGAGTAQALGDELEADEYSAKMLKQIFLNRARPDLIISAPEALPQELGRLESWWRDEAQGFWRAGKPMFINRKVDVTEMDISLRNLQFEQLREFEKMAVINTFGIPPELIGQLASSNRATVEAAERLFAKWVIMPRLEFLRATFQERLLPEYDDRLILDYVSPVEEDREFFLQASQAAPWARTVDEWRALQGLDPLPDEAGRIFYVPFNLVPASPGGSSAGQATAGAMRRALGGNGTSPDPPPPTHRALSAPKEAEEATLLKKDATVFRDAGDWDAERTILKALADNPDDLPALTRMAARLEPEARRAFLAAVDEVTGRINQEAVVAALEARDLVAVEQELQVAGLEPALRDRLLSTLRTAYGRGGDIGAQVLVAAGVSMRFDLTNPRAVEFVLTRVGERISRISEETRAAIRAATSEVLAGTGGDVRDLARQLRSMVGLTEGQARAVETFEARLLEAGVEPGRAAARAGRYAEAQVRLRAMTIARTEVQTAAAQGQHDAWLSAVDQGLLDPRQTHRIWITTPDDRLDPEICFPARTPVLTMTGWKPISRVALGEYVLTDQDRFRPVMKRMARHHTGEVVRVVIGKGSSIKVTATGNHPFLTRRGWVRADQLLPTDELAVSAVPCLTCGLPFPAGPVPVRSQLCGECRTRRPNEIRWSDPRQHAAMSAQNRRRWDRPGERERQSARMHMANPANQPAVREKIRVAALARPPRPKREQEQRRSPAEWAQSSAHPFRDPAIKSQVAARLARWRASLSEAQKVELQRRCVSGAGSRSRGGSYLERRVEEFLRSQHIPYEAQWPFVYVEGGRTRRGFADFYVPGARLVIECDGAFHTNPEVRRLDVAKSQTLEQRGHAVLRVTSSQVRNDFDTVASAIRAHCCLVWVKPQKIARRSIRHQPVYNLEVSDDHSYVAGGFVVHNCEPLDGAEAGLDEAFPGGYMDPPAHPSCRCSIGLVFL